MEKFIPESCPLLNFLKAVSDHYDLIIIDCTCTDHHATPPSIPSSCWSSSPQILDYERTSSFPARKKKAKAMYDKYIYADMLAMDAVSSGPKR